MRGNTASKVKINRALRTLSCVSLIISYFKVKVTAFHVAFTGIGAPKPHTDYIILSVWYN